MILAGNVVNQLDSERYEQPVKNLITTHCILTEGACDNTENQLCNVYQRIQGNIWNNRWYWWMQEI